MRLLQSSFAHKGAAVSDRRALTLVEVLVVFAILACLIGLLLPAVQASREKARETVCRNNLHQLNLAVAHYAEAHKRLPAPNPSGLVGGWTIEILPFLEETNLRDEIQSGIAISDAPGRCPACS